MALSSYLECLFHFTVDVREIREVRESPESSDHKKAQDDLKVVDAQCCFIIFYGSDFRLKTLSVAGKQFCYWVHLRSC